jgi:hypothetical protein
VVNPEHCDILHEHMSGDRDRILRERHAGAKVYNQGVKCMSTDTYRGMALRIQRIFCRHRLSRSQSCCSTTSTSIPSSSKL